ncbi:MAG: EAL domain-containing protein [Moraxellaceae bacterium]|nr:EAL domain-containing protein [Moraxellaceae bacterium]
MCGCFINLNLCFKPIVLLALCFSVLANIRRWVLLSPAQFIPLAEEAGLISAIGEIVLYKACQQTYDWHIQGFSHISTSVNVVAQQLQRGNLLDIVDRILLLASFQLPTAPE